MLKLSDCFERVTVISLPAREERRTALRAALLASGISDEGIQWHAASDGTDPPPPRGWQAGQGAWGCLQSHLAVMRCALRDNVESVLILEDDVLFHPYAAAALPAFLRAVPQDWGQLYLGGQHLLPARPSADPLVVIPSNVNRTHAFAVSRAGLPALISWLEDTDTFRHDYYHIDHQLGVAHEKAVWPVYAPSWWLAGQSGFPSDISGRALTTRWWHPLRWALRLPFFHLPPEMECPPGMLAENSKMPRPDAAAPSGSLLTWLHRTACEALEAGCLPALAGADSPLVKRLHALWPARVRAWEPDIRPLYPFDGLFPHPFAAAIPSPH